MSDKLTHCPCEKAPFPWCNNAEGCDTCGEYDAWAEQEGLWSIQIWKCQEVVVNANIEKADMLMSDILAN